MKRTMKTLVVFALLAWGLMTCKGEVHAVSYPAITAEFDETDQSVIVSGIPAYDITGTVQYELHGKLTFAEERVETFCYAPAVFPHHVPDKQAYIFNWSDAEFLLPGSGEYVFTTWVVALDVNNGFAKLGSSNSISITFHYQKKDESTNWGPGLPNTTVEAYDLGQIQGKDKKIVVEEEGYTWSIQGTDIVTVPEENLSLKITVDSENFNNQGVDDFFGSTAVSKFTIEHNGEFGFQAVLSYLLGADYAGKYANLFYVVGDGTFEYMEGVVVDEAGNASFAFTHASDYVIAVTEVPYEGQELNPKPEPEIESEPEAEERSEAIEESEVPVDALEENEADIEDKQTNADVQNESVGVDAITPIVDEGAEAGGINIIPWIIVGSILVIVAGIVVVMIRKRK